MIKNKMEVIPMEEFEQLVYQMKKETRRKEEEIEELKKELIQKDKEIESFKTQIAGLLSK